MGWNCLTLHNINAQPIWCVGVLAGKTSLIWWQCLIRPEAKLLWLGLLHWRNAFLKFNGNSLLVRKSGFQVPAPVNTLSSSNLNLVQLLSLWSDLNGYVIWWNISTWTFLLLLKKNVSCRLTWVCCRKSPSHLPTSCSRLTLLLPVTTISLFHVRPIQINGEAAKTLGCSRSVICGLKLVLTCLATWSYSKVHKKNGNLYGPAKAANAGGSCICSGMSQTVSFIYHVKKLSGLPEISWLTSSTQLKQLQKHNGLAYWLPCRQTLQPLKM